MFPNRYQHGLKSYMSQFLGPHYERNQDIIERIGHYVVTESDFKSFINLVVDIYESGFFKCAGDYKQHLDKAGIKVEFETKK